MSVKLKHLQLKPYQVLLHRETYLRAHDYLGDLATGKVKVGNHLGHLLDDQMIGTIRLLEQLVNTKRPQIFAESAVVGDGSDWNLTELVLLGDIAIAVPVLVYDNGRHRQPDIHDEPFEATLLYVPGALLRNGRSHTPADWNEVVKNGQIDQEAFYKLYERRLLPSFLYANEIAQSRNKQAFITMPGLGCGQFAGKFRGQLGAELEKVLTRFLHAHHASLTHIKAVYYDPYQECDNRRIEIGHLSLMVRPLTKGNQHKPQLCQPEVYEEEGDDFSNCELFSFVAWDHVSWPGNDFYIGSRATDDGVKTAATSSMEAMTGVEGLYSKLKFQYEPPWGYQNWNDVIQKYYIRLYLMRDNLSVYPEMNESLP